MTSTKIPTDAERVAANVARAIEILENNGYEAEASVRNPGTVIVQDPVYTYRGGGQRIVDHEPRSIAVLNSLSGVFRFIQERR